MVWLYLILLICGDKVSISFGVWYLFICVNLFFVFLSLFSIVQFLIWLDFIWIVCAVWLRFVLLNRDHYLLFPFMSFNWNFHRYFVSVFWLYLNFVFLNLTFTLIKAFDINACTFSILCYRYIFVSLILSVQQLCLWRL